jgi:hypothetical protein
VGERVTNGQHTPRLFALTQTTIYTNNTNTSAAPHLHPTLRHLTTAYLSVTPNHDKYGTIAALTVPARPITPLLASKTNHPLRKSGTTKYNSEPKMLTMSVLTGRLIDRGAGLRVQGGFLPLRK